MEIISVEKIKPTLPTPPHLRIHNISLLDQMMYGAYVAAVLYFFGNDSGDRIQHLKDSLSQTLVTLYPFVGVIRDALSADCNDEGLPFSVTKVMKVQMRDFLQNPNLELIKKFLPGGYSQKKPPGPGDSVMLIQLNCFDCGGIAMCISFYHIIADLASVSMFLQHWAANARGLGFAHVSSLNCVAQSFFPQNPSLPTDLIPFKNFVKYLRVGNSVMRRYVFDASALSVLKPQLSTSQVSAVSAMIWKCFMEVVAEEGMKPVLMTHSVNLRRQASPPFSDDSFGNLVSRLNFSKDRITRFDCD
ncbi:stemmadenine O-acetyltransferase-like [Salvia divinorum]|uniref:Stemmadenine O-acetyltransferase-like n=1 Tax=Salvia divinorum TaxID=28513 RepID=A0ABD1FQU9_SALDI